MKIIQLPTILALFARNMLSAGFLLIFVGCSVGPDYVAPTLDLPEQYDAKANPVATDLIDRWWDSFEDPVLTQCVQEALQKNQDIQVSVQRIRVVRAMRRMESSRFYPDIDAKLSHRVDRLSANNPRFAEAIREGIFPRDVEYWDAGFDVNWEIDIFGGTRRRVEGAVARIEEASFQQHALRISVSAEVARNYFEIRGNQHKLEIIDAKIENEESRIAILRDKHRSKLIPASQMIDSQTRKQDLESLKPTIQADIQAGCYRLAVLLGRRPEQAIAGLDKTRPLPASGGHVPVGLPSDLLRRRPDIKASERKLAAATADVGVAKSELFPRFFLTGSPGLQSGDFVDLFSSNSSLWLFGPRITWNIFSGNRNKARLETANARQTQALIEYEAAVNNALEDVESSLVRYGSNALSLRFVIEAMNTRRRDLDIQTIRHESGLTDALSVAESKADWLDSKRKRLEWQVNLLMRLVALYKSLGGGWEEAMQSEYIATTEP
jgi:outer membrane protein, multidrug efflux system